jgi:lipopolysaccharide export system ATP-binding protein
MALATEFLIKTFSKRVVVNKVNIEINPGEVVGLLGPNGAGKSTIFHMIVGLLKPNKGKVLLDGSDITRFPMYKRARFGIGYLAQEPSIFRRLTVRENIMAIIETLNISEEDKKSKLNRLLEELELDFLAGNKAYSLSGGEKRRVEITRALVTSPKYILLDEPFVGIDPIATVEIQQIITKLREKGLGILITDHNVRETLKIINRAYIIYEGQILISGTADDLLRSREAHKVYLGDKFKM